jgi:hypothetical protein
MNPVRSLVVKEDFINSSITIIRNEDFVLYMILI